MKKILLALLLLFPLSALAYEYTPASDVSVRDPFAEAAPAPLPGFVCQTERAQYRFAAEIAPADRDAFIDVQERLLAALDETGFTFHVLPDGAPLWVDTKTARLFPRQDGGISQALAALQSLYGETANYGLLYGAADQLCKAADLPGHTLRFNDKGMLKFLNDESNLSHFLLLYPSFSPDHTALSIIPYVKDLAVRFFAFAPDQALSLLAEKDLSLSQAAFLPLMNEFLTAQQAETQLNEHLPAIAVGSGGENCPLIADTAHGRWHILKDYAGPSRVQSLYQALWRVEEDMDHVDQCLAVHAETPLRFLLCRANTHGLTTNYQHYAGDGPIVLSSLDSALHEYVHARTQGLYAGDHSWFLSELAATYFEMQGSLSAHQTLYFSLLWEDHPDQAEYLAPVLDNEEFSFFSHPEEVYHYLCFSWEEYDLYTPSSRTLNAIRSFSCFLHDHFGDERVGRALAGSDPAAHLGADWEGLRQLWMDHLQSLYGEGTSL